MSWIERQRGRIRTCAGFFSRARLVDPSRLWQLWEASHLERLLPALGVDCVFDVGANDGQYARMLRRQAGYRGLIVSFEPIPEAAERVRRLARAALPWQVEELALSAVDGQAELNVMASPQFSSLSQPRHDDTDLFVNMNALARTVSVRTETLATAYRRLHARHGFRSPFLKLDTQGFDVKIVNGGAEVIQHFVGLQSELAIRLLYADSVDFRQALSIYEGHGFRLSAIVPNNAGHFPELMESDCIMYRPDRLVTP